VIWCRQPVSSLADLKGRKIRTFGASLNDFVTAIGAQPVVDRVSGGLQRA